MEDIVGLLNAASVAGAGSASSRIRVRRGVSALAAVLVVLFSLALPASAHSGEESYVYLSIFDTSIEGRVEFPVTDLGDVLGLDIPQDEAGASTAISASLTAIQQYAEDHLSLGDATTDWNLEFEGFEILEISNGTYALFPFVVDRDFAPSVPREFNISYDGMIESKPERSALLVIETDFGSGTFQNEADALLRFASDQTEQVVDLDDPSLFKGFVAVVGLGVEHIQIGSDHILFVVALLLPAVLIFRLPNGWEPATRFGSSLWRVAKIATSFTIAHTITLTLGGLGIIEIPSSIVEPIIALSIGLAALHNLRPVFFNKEWLVAFGFGLFHGFGFASLLSGLGLDRSNRVISLFGFNLGIELGQIAIILLLFPALFLLRRTRTYLPMMKAGSIALMAIAAGWFVDRTFGLDIGVDRIVTPVLLWPRPLWVAAGITLIASLVYLFERDRDRLIPVEPVASTTDSNREQAKV